MCVFEQNLKFLRKQWGIQEDLSDVLLQYSTGSGYAGKFLENGLEFSFEDTVACVGGMGQFWNLLHNGPVWLSSRPGDILPFH